MKRRYFFLLILAACAGAPLRVAGQSATAPLSMKSLVNDPRFVAAHLAPLAAEPGVRTGSWISMPTASGPAARGYEVRPTGVEKNTILVFHEWWGVNDFIINECERLAKDLKGVRVIAVDLFDGKVATTPEQATEQIKNASEERIYTIIQAAFDYLPPSTRLGTLGWCYGGGYSLDAAIMGAGRVKACVMYYGTPAMDPAKLSTLSAPVLGIFGTKDEHITPQVVKQFQKTMKAAGKTLIVKNYPAVHAFANPSNPKYNKAATADARKRMLTFFRKYLYR